MDSPEEEIRMRKRLSVCLLLICFVVGSVSTMASSIEDNLTYQGNKARISVGRIKSKANRCSSRMASAFSEMLSTSLANNNRFIVLASGDDLAEITEEIKFAQGGMVEEGKGAEAGLMEGADVLITGSVTMFEPNAKSTSIGGRGRDFANRLLGGARVTMKKATMGLDIKLIDIRQRRIIFATNIEGISNSWGVRGYQGGWSRSVAMRGDLGVYSNSPMEKAIRVALDKVIKEIAEKLPSSYYRYQGKGQYTQEYGRSGKKQKSQEPARSSNHQTQTPAEKKPAKPKSPRKKTIRKSGCDFVPGQKTIWIDDLSEDEVGEFPFNNKLDNGNFEVVDIGGEKWIMATTDGKLMPNTGKVRLPEKWTLELEIYHPTGKSSYPGIDICFVGDKGDRIGQLNYFSYGANFRLKGKQLGRKDDASFHSKGVHRLRLMVSKRSIKAYADDTRIANVPNPGDFTPASFALIAHGNISEKRPFYFRGFRIAEGGK